MSPSFSHTPKVLCLGYPAYAGEEYMKDFESKFCIDVVVPTNRKQTILDLAAKVASSGPYEALLIRMGTGPYRPFDAELLQLLLPHCKIIVSASAGYDVFDVDWITKNGIWLCNTRNAVSEATADMAIILILAVIRDTFRSEKALRNGDWRGEFWPSMDPSGLVLGIVGMGAIGKLVARKANAFNLKVHYFSRLRLSLELEEQLQATWHSTLEDLLRVSDVISLHVPLTNETRNLISDPEFALMKDGVFLINTARGEVVDEEALIKALDSGKVERAGLDCFGHEPNVHPYLMKSDKCVLQPHLGGLTTEAFKKAEIECLENIKALFQKGRPLTPVNEVGQN